MTRTLRLLTVAGVVALTLAGFLLRMERLAGAEGMVGEDEARLLLAATGIAESGVPRMPSGKLYFRGVVNSYLSAFAMKIGGKRDAVVRFPNVLLGALLVPVLFLFARSLTGGSTTAGFAVATFGAVQGELIRWSASAWMTSLLVVVFVAAGYALYRGFERGEPRMQVLGAAATVLAVLVHELGVLLALALFATLALRALGRDFAWFDRRRSPIALGLLAAAVAAFVVLGLLLRAETVAGPLGEFQHYWDPHVSGERFRVDFERWRHAYLPIALAALAGVLLLIPLRARRGLFLYVTMAGVAFTVWVVIDKTSERYGLVLLPLGALAGAWALAEAGRFIERKRPAATGRLIPFLLLTVFAIALAPELRRALERPGPAAETWLQEVRRLGVNPASDLILASDPEPLWWYFGRVDYWERLDSFARYTIEGPDGRMRHLYTGAPRVGSSEDFTRVMQAHPGRTLWYFGGSAIHEAYTPALRERMQRTADREYRTAEGAVVLRLKTDSLR
jgi:hypothetical protein